jgi:integrase
VTKRADEAVWALESSPRVPRGELSGRFAPRRKETKKEHRSFGTIVETRGRFKVRYTGPDRQLHRAGITFTTRERAQGWLSEERKLIELHEWTPPSLRRAQVHADELSFDEFARDWIAKRLVRGRPLKDRTREHYLDIHQRWFTALHELQLASITQADIDRWYHGLPAAPTMRSHAYSLLKAMYRTAVTRKLVEQSPVDVEGATARNTPKDVTLLTVAQVQALSDAMPPRHRLLILLAAWCGLRFGELTALRRRDIDLAEGTITVAQAAVTVSGQRLITTPKSAAGYRTIYLPPHLTEDVLQHLAIFTPTGADALVFPGDEGQPLTPGQVHGHNPRFDKRSGKRTHPGNGFYKARHQIGRPDFRFHDLRHFAATMAAISGATTKELMQFAGHSDIHVAMRYQEALTDRKRDLAHRMAALARVPTEGSHQDPSDQSRSWVGPSSSSSGD